MALLPRSLGNEKGIGTQDECNKIRLYIGAKSEGNYLSIILPLKRWVLFSAQLLAKHIEKEKQPYSNEKNC